MKNGLFVVEGASGSGKDTLLDALRQKGYIVLRGGPSQNHPQNKLLTEKSQSILGDTKVSLQLMLESPPEESQKILDRYVRIVQAQLQEAITQKNRDNTVFFNRSIISFQTHLQLVLQKYNKEEIVSETMERVINEVNEVFLNEVDGVIFMEEPIHGVIKAGIAGLQKEESMIINTVLQSLQDIKILRLNANKSTVMEELTAVESFITN